MFPSRKGEKKISKSKTQEGEEGKEPEALLPVHVKKKVFRSFFEGGITKKYNPYEIK